MIREKMEAHGLPRLDFAVVSDPSWSMMVLEPREQIFMENPSHTDLQNAEFFDQEYRMVQPALAVVDSSGEVVYWWSWNTPKRLDLHAHAQEVVEVDVKGLVVQGEEGLLQLLSLLDLRHVPDQRHPRLRQLVAGPLLLRDHDGRLGRREQVCGVLRHG